MNGVRYLSQAFCHFENSLESAIFLFTFSGHTVNHSNRQSLLDIIPPIVSMLESV
jgi:hypothetical protein